MNEHTNPIESAAVFADLCDYTRLTEQLGDGAAADMAVALGDIATTVARRHNGRVVKMLGDGAHLYFSRPADAVAASVAPRARSWLRPTVHARRRERRSDDRSERRLLRARGERRGSHFRAGRAPGRARRRSRGYHLKRRRAL